MIHVVPPTFTISPSNITGTVGSSVSFQCVAYGYPLPTLTWNWTDNIAGDIHISNTTVSDYTVSSTIAFIDNLILDDNPVIVKCEAVNDLVEEKVTMSTIGVLIDNCKSDVLLLLYNCKCFATTTFFDMFAENCSSF